MLSSAEEYDATQRRITAVVDTAVRAQWRRVKAADIDASWALVQAQVLRSVVAGQLAGAQYADGYVTAALDEQNVDAPAEAVVQPTAFAGIASDGRPLDTLLDQPRIDAKTSIGQGQAPAQALTSAGEALSLLAVTMVQDAARAAVGAAITARPRCSGYVRMLTPPSCARCAALAGKRYKWNEGFKRHPRCDCRHIPAHEDVAGDPRTDSRLYFESLPTDEVLRAAHPDMTRKQLRAAGLYSQEDVFTRAGAQAIRDGADLNQVVNARRGMSTAVDAAGRQRPARVDVYGQQLLVTNEGTTRRGLAGGRLAGAKTPRLMPESIYEIAEDREDAIRLLKRFGFIV